MVVHDQDLSISELRVGAELALSEHWGVSVMLPVRSYATEIRYLDGAGQEVALTGPNIHHRDETITGLSDPWLLGLWSGEAEEAATGRKWSFAARAGASLPLGDTVADPFARGDMGREHEHFQLGTGTVDPIVGVDVERRFEAWRVGVWALTKQTLYENGQGYQAGDRYLGGVQAESPLGTRAWSFRVGAEVQGETAETWGGVRREDEGNLGRVDVQVAAGARWRSGAWSVEASARVPVYEHVIGGQIHIPVVVEVGTAWAFDAWGGGGGDGDGDGDGDGHGHGHGHEHEHEHGEPGAVVAVEDAELDVLEFVKDGSAPELAPVPGKITVFDFWAPWCKPCKQLSGELRELSMRYPGRFAVRMVNVVDWDSPAAMRWLTPHDFSLPHLKVFDASGTLIYEKSSSPAVLLGDMKDILER